jgi:yeast amino acid transporter
MGVNYVLQWAATLPVELTAASFTIQYWAPNFPVAGSITIFWVVIIIINLFGTLGYAEEEFWASGLKLIVTIAFLITGVILNCGGGPKSGAYGEYVGGKYWHNPGALAAGFQVRILPAA